MLLCIHKETRRLEQAVSTSTGATREDRVGGSHVLRNALLQTHLQEEPPFSHTPPSFVVAANSVVAFMRDESVSFFATFSFFSLTFPSLSFRMPTLFHSLICGTAAQSMGDTRPVL